MLGLRDFVFILALLFANLQNGQGEPCKDIEIEPSVDDGVHHKLTVSNHLASDALPDDIFYETETADSKSNGVMIRVARALGEFAVGLLRQERAFGRGQFSQVINPSRVNSRRISGQQTAPIGRRI